MTWVVIIASTLACPIWTAIYSQFATFDFRDEISILFASAYFWFAVFLSTAFALGMCSHFWTFFSLISTPFAFPRSEIPRKSILPDLRPIG